MRIGILIATIFILLVASMVFIKAGSRGITLFPKEKEVYPVTHRTVKCPVDACIEITKIVE